MVTVKRTELRTVKLLESNGIPIEYWELPKELGERRSGPSLTHDDVINFHEALRDDEAFDASLAELADELLH